MNHLVLLGDSIFDNQAWAYDGPETVVHLRDLLPADWQASLLATDGDTTAGVIRQASRIPADASFLAVSAGGNNALAYIAVLTEAARTNSDAFTTFFHVIEEFERHYQAMLDVILSHRLPTVVCTIYNPRFPEPDWQRCVVTTLALFNDCIIRCALRNRLPVLELRHVCTEAGDFTNAIEPSSQGGQKIAAALARLIQEVQFHRHKSEIF